MSHSWLRRFDPRGEPRPIWGAAPVEKPELPPEDRAPEEMTLEQIIFGAKAELIMFLDKWERR